MSIFENLSGNQKFVLSILLLTIITFGVFLITTSLFYALIAVAIIYIILLAIKAIWIPTKNPKLLVALASLGLISAVALASMSFWGNFLQSIIVTVLNSVFSNLKLEPQSNTTTYIILGFTLAGVGIINYFFHRDNSAMGLIQTSIDKDIPDRGFKEKFKSVCEELANDLRNIDRKTNWSNQNFIPIEAEVEIITNDQKQRKVTDLLKAIKNNTKERTFLVLGDPGSGKSVALRKLCQDLLNQESKKTYKIPIYINLKEWRNKEKWSKENPPTVHQLKDFVLKILYNGDISTADFFKNYFDRLYDLGRLYFVMDSFDEIPAVLDEQEKSDLIDKLSEAIFKFLKGARAEESQGILSSRLFRKPTDSFQTNTTLEIRPFSENKIIKSFEKRLFSNATEIVSEIFLKRRELVPMVRNPFLATLIIDYIDKHKGALPNSQSETYSSYILKSLTNPGALSKLEANELTTEDVINTCIRISEEIFENKSLEISINLLRKKYSDINIDEVVNILKFVRIGRGNESDENQFSFVHRRFAEYFYVQHLMKNLSLVNYEVIPNDSQMRDALVLFCEVAEFEEVKKIANFCWKNIKNEDTLKSRSVIHCLLFLSDAFKGRLECLEDFRDDLADFINKQVTNPETDILSVKIVLESLGLIRDSFVDGIVQEVMITNNSWLQEVAIKSCRHLGTISDNLERNIGNYIIEMDILHFLKQYDDLKFSFNLSDSFEIFSKLIRYKYSELFNPLIFTSILILLKCIFLDFNILFSFEGFLDIIYAYLLLYIFFRWIPFFFKILSFTESKNLRIRAKFRIFSFSALIYFIFNSKSERNLRWYHLFRSLKFIFACIGIFIFAFTSTYFLSENSILNIILDKINRIVPVVIIIGFLVIVIEKLRIFSNDHKYYNRFNITHFNQREEIQVLFSKLKTGYYRNKLVTYLENNIDRIEGEWKGNFLKLTDDEYITRIARLDEKWLNLGK